MKNNKDNRIRNNGFNLISVIIIIIITAIASGLATGVIITNNQKSKDGILYKDLLADKKLKEFLDVYSSVSNGYYKNVDKDRMLDAAISSMLNYLDDSYTTYMNSNESSSLSEKLEGTYRGIGITIKDRTITSVMDTSPASKAGLSVGDTIVKINDIDVTKYSSGEIALLIRSNPEAETIKIEVERQDKHLTFNIATADLSLPVIVSGLIENTKIGYMIISIFSKNASEQFASEIKELKEQGMESLIIDLRNNTGGYLSQAESIASVMLQKGKTIYSLENKSGMNTVYDETEESLNLPIVVLINGETASASEILTTALIDSYGIKTVGEKSFGKGKVQQTVTLSDNSMAKYTSARWLRPNGECIDGIGITPDYEVKIEYEKDKEGNIISYTDTQLNKAIELLK